jgi:hypothetical protein
MFNIFKVTSLLQSVPTFSSDHNHNFVPQEDDKHEHLAFSPKKDKRSSSPSKSHEKGGRQSKGKNDKKDNDDNDNNRGGFL